MFKRIAAACLCAALISSPAIAKSPSHGHHAKAGHAAAGHKTGHAKKHGRHGKKKGPRHGARHHGGAAHSKGHK